MGNRPRNSAPRARVPLFTPISAPRRRPVFETLESRLLLSGDIASPGVADILAQGAQQVGDKLVSYVASDALLRVRRRLRSAIGQAAAVERHHPRAIHWRSPPVRSDRTGGGRGAAQARLGQKWRLAVG